MVLLYCVKCRSKTESGNEKQIRALNGRKRIHATCRNCKNKKSSFVSMKAGDGFVDKIPIEMRLPHPIG